MEKLENEKAQDFPQSATVYYRSLADPRDPGDPVGRQIYPDPREMDVREYECPDPLTEERFRVLPRLIHRYPDRVLLHVTSLCPVNCRHCFRRGFIRKEKFILSREELQAVRGYLAEHREVKEILLSGGDPLILGDEKLKEILSGLRREDLLFRVGSRMPVVQPSRITYELVDLLGQYSPLWVATHFNHPRELTPESSAALERLVKGGIPVVNQAVLLRGVNDDPGTLALLFRGLLFRGVKPYYLLQGDLAPGTAHFRVPLKRSIALYRELSRVLSGLALPKLAVDLPGGGGKVQLSEGSILREEAGFYILKGYDGNEYKYPVEE